MKKKLYLILLIFLTSCYRYNPSVRANWAKNSEFVSQYGANSVRTPINNIPYITLYVTKNPNYTDEEMKEKMTKHATNSYYKYKQEIQDMKDTFSEITESTKQHALAEQGNVEYVYNPETNEYDLDSNSLKTTIELPDMRDKYNINSRMGYKTAVPYKNAFAILNMKRNGYAPNEKYFQDMEVKYNTVKTTQEPEHKYAKIDKKSMYMLAGEDDLSKKFISKIYGKKR